MQAEEYIACLLSSLNGSSCMQAGLALQISHNEVNRFLLSGAYQREDLFKAIALNIDLLGGALTIDDTVLDKPCPYTELSSSELVGYFWLGKHHKLIIYAQMVIMPSCFNLNRFIDSMYGLHRMIFLQARKDNSSSILRNSYYIKQPNI